MEKHILDKELQSIDNAIGRMISNDDYIYECFVGVFSEQLRSVFARFAELHATDQDKLYQWIYRYNDVTWSDAVECVINRTDESIEITTSIDEVNKLLSDEDIFGIALQIEANEYWLTNDTQEHQVNDVKMQMNDFINENHLYKIKAYNNEQ